MFTVVTGLGQLFIVDDLSPEKIKIFLIWRK